jgi:hypothetical protein
MDVEMYVACVVSSVDAGHGDMLQFVVAAVDGSGREWTGQIFQDDAPLVGDRIVMNIGSRNQHFIDADDALADFGVDWNDLPRA